MGLLVALLLLISLSLRLEEACATLTKADFIIVGAGTAGSVLAGRLCAALPKAKIILLERAPPRGREAEFLVRSPRNAVKAWGSDLVSEIFPSTPNPGLNGRRITISTGHTLGGSSAMNGMQFTVPLRGTIPAWRIRRLTEARAGILFRRTLRTVKFRAQRPPLRQVYVPDYITASEKAGFVNTKRPLAGTDRDEIWQARLSVDRHGRRIDSFTAYVAPVINSTCKDNLVVMEDATVTQIVLKPRRGKLRAVGVNYVSTADRGASGRKRLFARQEVILSAGPYGSPKLLQLSGIGPRTVLEAAGIPVKVELPVGSQTQARPSASFTSLYPGVPIEPSNNETLINSPESRAQFEAGLGGVYGTAISNINSRVKSTAYTATVGNFDQGQGLGVPIISSACFSNSRAFGSLRITGKDPFAPPDVDLNLLGAQVDMDLMLKCLRRVSGIHAQFPAKFMLINQTPTGSSLNEAYVRSVAGFPYHYVGGCRVQKVVNRNLLVRRVGRIRVVDVSVLNRVPRSAGVLASAYLLGEFMAERIAAKYRRFAA